MVNQPVTIRTENAEWMRDQPLSLSAMVRNAIDDAMDGELTTIDCDRRDGLELDTTSVRISSRHQEYLSGCNINLSATIDMVIDERRASN